MCKPDKKGDPCYPRYAQYPVLLNDTEVTHTYDAVTGNDTSDDDDDLRKPFPLLHQDPSEDYYQYDIYWSSETVEIWVNGLQRRAYDVKGKIPRKFMKVWANVWSVTPGAKETVWREWRLNEDGGRVYDGDDITPSNIRDGNRAVQADSPTGGDLFARYRSFRYYPLV